MKRGRARGATLPEYALLLFAVLLVGAGAYRTLGARVDNAARVAGDTLLSGGEGLPGTGGGIPGIGAGIPGVRGGAPSWASAVGGFVRDFARGLVLGDFAEGGNGIARTAGQVVGGFIPIVGQLGDIRDLGAAVRDIAQGREGGWTNLALAGVGVVPGFGDAAKGILRGGDAARSALKNADEIGDAIKDGRRLIKDGEKAGEAGLTPVAGTLRRNADEAAEAARRASELARGEELYRNVLSKVPASSPQAKEIRKMIDDGQLKVRVIDANEARLGHFEPPKPGEVPEINVTFEGRSGPSQRAMAESMYHEATHVKQWERAGKPSSDDFYEYYKQNYHWMETEAELAGRTMNRQATPETVDAVKKFVKDSYGSNPDLAKVNGDYWRSPSIEP